MSFVITNNVHYYDLTLDITIVSCFGRSDKMPTAEFFPFSVLILLFSFCSTLWQSLAFFYQNKERKVDSKEIPSMFSTICCICAERHDSWGWKRKSEVEYAGIQMLCSLHFFCSWRTFSRFIDLPRDF